MKALSAVATSAPLGRRARLRPARHQGIAAPTRDETLVTILIADQHVLFRQGLAALLREQAGWKVVGEAGDGEDAVRLAGALAPRVAMVDIEMPGMGGVETARAIRKASRETRIIALSMYTNPHYRARMLDAGASAYVLKNQPFDTLVDAMHVILRGGTFVSRATVTQESSMALQSARIEREKLSSREQDVLRLLAQGKSTREVAGLLAVSPKTIETYRGRVRQKLGISSVAELVRFAIRADLVSPGF